MIVRRVIGFRSRLAGGRTLSALCALALMSVALAACGESDDDVEPPAPTVTAPAPVGSPSASTAAPAAARAFGDGAHIIGVDIEPGLYRAADASSLCAWARLSGLGRGSDDLIANNFGAGPHVVEILSTDAGFAPSDCGEWVAATEPVRDSSTAPLGAGTYIVGLDVAAGIWRAADVGYGCYWERLGGFSGEIDDLIANDLGTGPHVVEIRSTDAGFSSSDCSTWRLATEAVRESSTAPLGAGTYIVGLDVAAGAWRAADAGEDCYWARLARFSGESDDIIAEDVGAGPHAVEIDPTDAGFYSSDCGSWELVE